MKKIGVIWVYLFAAVISVAVLALDLMLNQAMAMSGPSDREKALERREKNECDFAVNLETDSFKLKFDHTVSIFRDGRYEVLTEQSCKLQDINGNIDWVKWRAVDILSETIVNPVTIEIGLLQNETLFSRYSKLLLESGYDLNKPKEVFHLDRVNSEIYVFGQGIPTQGGEPVAFMCGGSLLNRNDDFYLQQCETSYVHPKGFSLSYHFFRSTQNGSYQNLPESFVEIDGRIRKKIEPIVIKK